MDEWEKTGYKGNKEHLKRVIELYEEMGFEVKTEEVPRSECGPCTLCYGDGEEGLYKLLVRRKDKTESELPF